MGMNDDELSVQGAGRLQYNKKAGNLSGSFTHVKLRTNQIVSRPLRYQTACPRHVTSCGDISLGNMIKPPRLPERLAKGSGVAGSGNIGQIIPCRVPRLLLPLNAIVFTGYGVP